MAKILDQEEQKKALKQINASIRVMKEANEFLAANNPSDTFVISFKGEDDKKYSAQIPASAKESIAALILNFKEQEKSRIIELAKENRIELDEKDHAIMNYRN